MINSFMIIYKTINLVNGHYYIGKDQKNNPKYLGSGLALTRAIKKYGREKFSKIILEHCVNADHLANREKYWIKEHDAVNDPNSYNIHEGGKGGNTGAYHKVGRKGKLNAMYGKKHSDKSIKKQKESHKIWRESADGIEHLKNRQRQMSGENNWNYGIKMSSETKSKMKASLYHSRGKDTGIGYISYYRLVDPYGKEFLFEGKFKLVEWLKENGLSLYAVERCLLKNKQPRSGKMVGWKAQLLERKMVS